MEYRVRIGDGKNVELRADMLYTTCSLSILQDNSAAAIHISVISVDGQK